MKIPFCEKEYELHVNDVDKNNKMTLIAFLKFMQETGALHSKEFGYGINDVEKTHKAWVVLAWDLNIISRPRWNEKIKVKSWIGKLDKIYYYRDFKIYDSENNVIAKAVSKWIMVDTLTQKFVKIEEKHIEKIQEIKVDDYNNDIKNISNKIKIEESNLIYYYKVQKRDIDTNNHMNNTIYLDLALEGLDDKFIDKISNIQIYYKAECKLNDTIAFLKCNNKVYVTDENKEKLYALIILN